MGTVMKHRKWGDNDKHWGPFTYARSSKGYSPLGIALHSGEEEYPGCYFQISGFGHTVLCSLPSIIPCYREKVIAHTWDDATVLRMGRDWYWRTDPREYGFSYCTSGGVGDGGFLQVFLGRQSHDSSTEQRWSWFTPWNNWRHVRHSMYDIAGNHFWTEPERKKGEGSHFDLWYKAKDTCPSLTFAFNDFDGEFLTAKTRIEERQWELGTGWFKWLSRFKKPIIHRSLDIDFSGETGKRKGSWKGGTVGHSIEMLPGELHEAAFKRYCAEHEMKFRGRSATIKA